MEVFKTCTCGETFYNKPTAEEDLIEWARESCPKCGHVQPRCFSIEEWIVDLDIRLRAIEERHEFESNKENSDE